MLNEEANFLLIRKPNRAVSRKAMQTSEVWKQSQAAFEGNGETENWKKKKTPTWQLVSMKDCNFFCCCGLGMETR